MNLILPLYKDRVFTGFELQYADGVHPFYAPENTIDPYWVANWTLFSQKLIKGVEFSASIYNLFD